MAQNIDKDHKRFRDIVRGRVRKDLKKFTVNEQMIGKRGKDFVSIPLPKIQPPRLRHGQSKGGVGSGEGDIGDSVGKAGDKPGSGEAGDSPGEHTYEADVSLDELAEILGEALDLPNIEPKGTKNVKTIKDKYSSARRTGPESLRLRKKTFMNALVRSIASGEYDPDDPIIVPEREDKMYRSWKEVPEPEASAVIFYMMDVSGSMGEEQKTIVRLTSFWIDTWIRHFYKNLEFVYIIHDARAKEVDQETFYHTRESGGTVISSAYELCEEIIRTRFPVDDWNIYALHFSDGDNWSSGDNEKSIAIIKRMLDQVNLFAYGQVKSPYGSGEFMNVIGKHGLDKHERVRVAQIDERDDILPSIKTFLGKGEVAG